MQNDLIRINFEGIYFPIEETIEIIKPFLMPASQGKVDYIDIEEWISTRHTIQGMRIINSSNSLNAIMDYSIY